jgi:serpin B
VELAVANRIFVKEAFPLLAEFTGALEKSFKASAQNVNFTDPATIKIVNDWVAEQTKDKIKDLIKPGELS